MPRRIAIATLLAGSLGAALLSGCPSAPLEMAAGKATAADRQAMPGAAPLGDDYVLIPRTAGEKVAPVRGNTPLTTADPFSGSAGQGGSEPSGAPVNSGSGLVGNEAGGGAGAGGTAPAAEKSIACAGEITTSLGLYAAGGQVLLASGNGVYTYSGDSYRGESGWTPVASRFPCGIAPAAIAAASGSYFAGAPDGIYRFEAQARGWEHVVTAGRVTDLDIAPAEDAGMAIEEGAPPLLFDGKSWTPQSRRLASRMGGVRTLSATESYAVALSDSGDVTVLGLWNGVQWSEVTQPDPGIPVTGIAVRREPAPALIGTTRLGLYRRTAAGWEAELGPDAGFKLGTPAFSGVAGFVTELAVRGGRSFSYGGAGWQEVAGSPEPLETVVTLAGGDALALGADGETLFLHSGGAWKPVVAP